MFTQLNFNTPKNLVNSKIILFKLLPHVFKNFWLGECASRKLISAQIFVF